MYSLADLAFVKALFSSSTFLLTLAEVLGWIVVGLIILMYCLRRVKVLDANGSDFPHAKLIHKDIRGVASAVDFVMVVPLFMFIMCVFVQLAMIVNASLIVHYAAYSAARTARVHYCNRSVVEYPLGFLSCNLRRAEREAEKAAKFVLIAASPVDTSVPSSGTPPQQVIDWLSTQYLERSSPLITQANYAFDSRNVDVEVEPATSSNILLETQFIRERIPPIVSFDRLTDKKLRNSWPVTVTVKYSKHLGVPLVGPFLSDERRGNDHFQTIEAKITLL